MTVDFLPADVHHISLLVDDDGTTLVNVHTFATFDDQTPDPLLTATIDTLNDALVFIKPFVTDFDRQVFVQ